MLDKRAAKVNRSRVIAAAEQAVEKAKRLGMDVSPRLEASLLEVAKTADRISMAWQVRDCGCLVGTMRMRMGAHAVPTFHGAHALDTIGSLASQRTIGIAFPEKLFGEGWSKKSYYDAEKRAYLSGDEAVFEIVNDVPQGMDIGEEKRTIIVEPTENPIPATEPAPARKPVRTPAPEKEPAKQEVRS